MGFIDVHVHGPKEASPSIFRWDIGSGKSTHAGPHGKSKKKKKKHEDEAKAARYKPSPKLAAVGLLVVLGFLVVTGLLVKRKLGDRDWTADDLDDV